jgi:hypothetical protein
MSFQIPATPSFTRSSWSPPHQRRVADRAKSGKTLGLGSFSACDGQTGASKRVPSAPFTKCPPASPSSVTRLPGTFAGCGSTMTTVRKPSAASSPIIRPGSGKRSRSQVKGR